MRLKYIAIIPFLLLSACVEKTHEEMTYSERKELAEKFIQNCRDQGFTEDDPQMETCFQVEVDRDAKRRQDSKDRAEQMGMAISEGMKSYGDSMSRQSYAATYRQPINCTSTRLGYSVSTSCY